MRKSIFYILFLSMLLSSCFKEIDTEPRQKSTEVVFLSNHNITQNVTFFKIYENTTQEVANRHLGGWDMAFQSAQEGDNVLVNYTVSAKVIKTGTSIFSTVNKNTVNTLFNSDDWKFNDPAYSNVRDSIGLKDWEDKEVYLINRGSASLTEEAYYKIQFISKTPDSYTFRYAHVDSENEIEKTINRTSSLANVYFSFEENDVVDHEPSIDGWDFYFAPYFGWFETLTPGEYSPYNITGVMINNEGGVRVAHVFDGAIDYNSIDLNMAQSLIYSDWKGGIGSTWKEIPSMTNPIYLMDTDKKYVVKLKDGSYYKLRFLDYYHDGKQGFTSFEINNIK